MKCSSKYRLLAVFPMDQLAPSQMDQLAPTIPRCKSSRMTGASLNLEKENTHDEIP